MATEHVSSHPLSLSRPATSRRLGLYLSERRLLLLVGDLAMLSLALLAALRLRIPYLALAHTSARQLVAARPEWWLLLGVLWVAIAAIAGCYDLRRAARIGEGAVHTAGCALVVSALYLVVPVISAPLTRSRLAWFLFAGLASVAVAGWRAFYAWVLASHTFSRRVLIVGAGQSAGLLARAIDDLGPSSGITVVGLVDDDPAKRTLRLGQASVLGRCPTLTALCAEIAVDEVVVAITDPGRIRPETVETLVRCWEAGVHIVPMSLYYEELQGALPIDHIGANLFALIDRNGAVVTRLWDAARRLLDIVAGAVGLLLLIPFLPLIALAIYLDNPGPIFYQQIRVGRGGRPFVVTKFRSMVPDAERDGAQWSQESDPRVTRVGRWLRKTRLDETPQLWNLLNGTMSLIGPRPERPEFVDDLAELLPYYRIRHSVKPGITGWAQVCYRYGNSVDDAKRKLEYDLYYIKRRGPVLDVLILLRTIRVVLQMQGT
jgi:exopolysaccharide biosynthesis polyprenyl glycosylphosphotransferase